MTRTSPRSTPSPSPVTACPGCDADAPVRVVDADGATRMCVLHAITVLTRAEQGATVALLIDTAAIACPYCGAGRGHFPNCPVGS